MLSLKIKRNTTSLKKKKRSKILAHTFVHPHHGSVQKIRQLNKHKGYIVYRIYSTRGMEIMPIDIIRTNRTDPNKFQVTGVFLLAVSIACSDLFVDYDIEMLQR